MRNLSWLSTLAFALVVIALLRPDVAHLALRALLVVLLATVGAALLGTAIRSVPPSPFRAELPDDEIPQPELPRDLVGLADELRTRGQYLSEAATARLAGEFRATLRARAVPEHLFGDEVALSRHVSPHAAALVASGGQVLVGRRQLDSLLHELEHL